LAEQGHEVFFGGHTAKKGKDVADVAGQDTKSGTNDEAAAECCYHSASKIQQRFDGDQDLGWKILIDCNNFDIQKVCLCADCAIFSRNWQQKF